MILHVRPSLCLRIILAAVQFLYLLDVVPAMREQETVHRVLRQVWIRLAQKVGNLLRVRCDRLCRGPLGGSITIRRGDKISPYGTVVAGKKLEKTLFSRRPVEGLDSRSNRLRIGNNLLLRCFHGRIVLVERCERNVAYPEYVMDPQISQRRCGLPRFLRPGGSDG